MQLSFNRAGDKSKQQIARESAVSKGTRLPALPAPAQTPACPRGERARAAKSTMLNADARRAALPGPRAFPTRPAPAAAPGPSHSAPRRTGSATAATRRHRRLPAAFAPPVPTSSRVGKNLPAEPPAASSLSKTPLCFAPRSSPLDFQTSLTILIISGKSQARGPC